MSFAEFRPLCKKIIKLTFSHWFFNSIIKNCSTCCSSESFCRWFLCCNFFLIFFTAGKHLIFYFINSWHYILVVIQKSVWSVTNFMWKRFQLVFNTVYIKGGLISEGSDKIIYWIGRYSFLLGFITSKNPKDLWFYILIKKFSTQPLMFVWHHKTLKEKVSIESINYIIRPHL